jgi:hypothetical protein
MTNIKGQSLYVLVLLALGACLAAAGCGGDEEGKPIPAATATALQSQLDNIQARVDNGSAGACRDIVEGSRGPNKQQVQQLIDSMPDSVDSDVRSALQDSFDNLWDLVDQDCQDKADKEQSQKQEQPEEPTQTETTPTETTPTETTPTETTPTETTPPSEGNDNNGGGGTGNGNGNGNGNGLGGGVAPDGADLGGG